jgi:hypothetical protein
MMKRDRDLDETNLENPLGLADEPITRSPSDHLESSSDPATRRRRARALGEDGIDRHSTGLGDTNVDPDGAAGIDMGYGGEGTDIKPSR